MIENSNFWKNKRVLVTGHTGFKGSWLSLFLKYLDAEVYGISKEPNEGVYKDVGLSKVFAGESFVDISSYEFLNCETEIRRFNPDIVFHFAAQSLVYKGYTDPLETLKTNIIGTFNVLNSLKEIDSLKTIVVATTDKVYKKSDFNNIEDSPLGGKDFYSSSKVGTENVVTAFANMQKLFNISVVRSGNVIGGGDRAEKRLVVELIESLKKNKDFLLRKPNSIRPWQYILDSVFGYLLVAEENYKKDTAEIYNLNSKTNNKYDAKFIAEKFVNTWGSKISINILDNEEFEEVDVLRIDSSKAKKKLGWIPKVSIEKLVEETVKWEKFHSTNNTLDFSFEQINNYLEI